MSRLWAARRDRHEPAQWCAFSGTPRCPPRPCASPGGHHSNPRVADRRWGKEARVPAAAAGGLRTCSGRRLARRWVRRVPGGSRAPCDGGIELEELLDAVSAGIVTNGRVSIARVARAWPQVWSVLHRREVRSRLQDRCSPPRSSTGACTTASPLMSQGENEWARQGSHEPARSVCGLPDLS